MGRSRVPALGLLLLSALVISTVDGEEPESWPDETLRAIWSDQDRNGIVETYTMFESNNVLLVVKDTDQNGVLDRFEYHAADGRVLTIEDRNADKMADRWEVRGPDGKGFVARDTDFTGEADDRSHVTYVTRNGLASD